MVPGTERTNKISVPLRIYCNGSIYKCAYSRASICLISLFVACSEKVIRYAYDSYLRCEPNERVKCCSLQAKVRLWHWLSCLSFQRKFSSQKAFSRFFPGLCLQLPQLWILKTPFWECLFFFYLAPLFFSVRTSSRLHELIHKQVGR